MAPGGRNLGKRQEHESTLVEPRVRQDERGCLGHLTPMVKKIEIEHARRISLVANTAELLLDRLQYPQ